MSDLFIEDPKIEWHHNTPFAIARLNIKYAKLLTKLALDYENEIIKLDVNKNWVDNSENNPTGSRFTSYNTFLLDSAYMPLFLALRKTFRFLLKELNQDIFPCYIRSWYNIHREGLHLHRHTHEAKFIGSFLAFTEGSYTSYGPLKDSNGEDHVFTNYDGTLIITKSDMGNFHEVSKWTNQDHPRVSYAFDIEHQYKFNKNKSYIPFDGE